MMLTKDKEMIRVTLTVTLQTEDGSPIGDLDCDLENDLNENLEHAIENGLLTAGHDELIVSEYRIETQTVD